MAAQARGLPEAPAAAADQGECHQAANATSLPTEVPAEHQAGFISASEQEGEGSIMRRLLVVRTDFLAASPESVGELRHTPLQSLDPVGEEANHLVEIADRLILKRDSALELQDSLFHCRIVLTHFGPSRGKRLCPAGPFFWARVRDSACREPLP